MFVNRIGATAGARRGGVRGLLRGMTRRTFDDCGGPAARGARSVAHVPVHRGGQAETATYAKPAAVPQERLRTPHSRPHGMHHVPQKSTSTTSPEHR